MLLSWFMGPAAGGMHACCTRHPKAALGCLRGREGEAEAAAAAEYAPHGHSQAAAAELVVDDGALRGLSSLGPGLLPAGPAERTVPTFATGQDAFSPAALQGRPLYKGDILRLTLGDSIHEAVMTLHVNGFVIAPRENNNQQPLITRLWSPFSLVEKCQVRTKHQEAQWAIFKLTIFRKEGQDSSFYCATAGHDAARQRDRWVEEITQAISNLALSLFPRFDISVEPVPGRAGTSTRILAGYLLQGGAADRAALVFCELHAYLGREARLTLYKDEFCEQEVLNIRISESSVVSTRKGAYCTVFGINDQLFCARTEDERELWLRAVSNIKVKLMFDAPDPSPEELEVFRSSVAERAGALPPPLPPGGKEAAEAFAAAAAAVGALGLSSSGNSTTVAEPLLAQVPRRPPLGPLGDACADPEPIAEDSPDSPSRYWGGFGASVVAQAPCGVAGDVCNHGSPAEEEKVEMIPSSKSEPGAAKLPWPAAAPEAAASLLAAPPLVEKAEKTPKLLGCLVATPADCAGAAVVSMDAVLKAEVEGL